MSRVSDTGPPGTLQQRHPALRCVHHWPTRVLCVFLIAIQAASMNWYLMDNMAGLWALMFAADAVVVTLFIASFFMSTDNIYKEKHSRNMHSSDARHLPLAYITWFVYAGVLDAKIVVIFTTFSTELDENYFFGPNTLKTTMALAALIFLTFLTTLHDVKHGQRKDMVTSLTATILFDILDGVDSMENLFEAEDREAYPPGLADTVIAIACINFLLPAIPLFTLAKCKFGLKELPFKFELLHKFALAYLVNLPLFITRMITWHGLASGISIFLLKNVIAMGIVTFEVCEHYCCPSKHEHHERHESIELETSGSSELVPGGRHVSTTPV